MVCNYFKQIKHFKIKKGTAMLTVCQMMVTLAIGHFFNVLPSAYTCFANPVD